MSIVLKDGTLAPDIPEGVLDSYPNAVIAKCTSTLPSITSVMYVLVASDVPYVGIPAEMGELPADMIASLGSKNIHYGYSQGGTEWGDMSQNEGPDAIYNGYIPGDTVNQTWEVQWSNHDIFTAVAFDGDAFEVTVGTEIYFPNSVPKFILPDGTELPALPEGCFEKYPYGMISYVESTDGEAAYALSVAEGTYIFAPGSATGEGSDYVISLLPGYRHYRYVVAPTAASGWEQYAESTTQHSGHDFSREDGTIEIRWCNHDILTATAKNDDGTYEIGTDLYRKSDVNYRVYGGWLNSMGNQARRLGNVSGALKPGEMESVFSGATLEPLTVTPTTEEQTFTPESPCIGFSSVTVEAAPDTGGGDIVEPETYPDAENVNFGTTSAGKELYTGKYFYGTYPNAINLPDGLTEYPYLTLLKVSSHPYYDATNNVQFYTGILLFASSDPFGNLNNNEVWTSGKNYNAKYIMYALNETDQTWSLLTSGTGYGRVGSGFIFYWSNEDIYYGTASSMESTVWKRGSAPVPETVDSGEIEYIETAETYTISGATLNALGAVTQQITGKAATTPSGMVSALQMYAGTH